MEMVTKGNEKAINSKWKRLLFVLLYLFTIVSVIISPFVGAALVLLATLLFAFSLISLPQAYCYAILFGLFPFANIFKLAPESMSFLTVCEILLLAKIVLESIFKSRTFKANAALTLTLTFTVLYMMVFSERIDYLNIIKTVVRAILVASYLRSIASNPDRIKVIKALGYCLSFSMLLMMVLSQIEPYMEGVSGYLRAVQLGGGSELMRNCGLLDDPNYCSLAIMATLTFITVLYYYKLIKVEYWLLTVPLFLIGFTTYSKSYFLVAAAFLILLLFFVLFPKHKGWAIVLSIVSVLVVSSILRGEVEIINKVLERFETDGLTTGRDELNELYLQYIFGNAKVLFLGEGFAVTAISGMQVAHNLYIETWFRLGLVGSLLFVAMIMSCFPKQKMVRKLINYMPALFVVVMYMALAGLDSYGLFYYILLAGISALHISNAKNENFLEE